MSLVSPRSALRRRAWAVAGVSTAAAVAAAVPLASPVAAAPAAPAVSAAAPVGSDPGPSALAGAWLERQLTDGVAVTSYTGSNGVETFQDYGLTVDIANALAASGRAAGVEAAASALAENEGAYTRPGFGTNVSAGSTAKLAGFAQAADLDPRSFGGTDLIAQLESRVAPADAPTSGRISDDFDPADQFAADYANVFGQAYAVGALDEAGSAAGDRATDFLLDQQCGEGFFRLYFSEADAADQTCDGAGDAAAPSVDATALAVLALAGQADDTDVRPAVEDALTWLVDAQAADGSFSDGDQIGPNANSTGLAGQALAAAGTTLTGELAAASSQAAVEAAVWVRRHQVGDLATCVTALQGEVGAVAYDDAALAAGRRNGIVPATTQYQWRLATAQSTAALASAPDAAEPLAIRVSPSRQRAGALIGVTVTGVAPGETACVVGGTAPVTTSGGVVRLTLPRGNTLRNLYVGTLGGAAKTALWALDAKTPTVLNTPTVRRGGLVTLRIAGLAPGEPFTAFYRGQTRVGGRADAAGRAQVQFVGALNAGYYGLRVTGQYADRVAVSSFRVIP